MRCYLFFIFLLNFIALQSTFAQEDRISEYQKEQDSLRLELKKEKNDSSFNSPFIEELYLKGLATKEGDSINIFIPFDSHSADCGAPDCYVTEVSFSLPIFSPLILPDSLDILYCNTGCYQDSITGYPSTFHAINKGEKMIIYYNWNDKASLILFTKDGKKLSGATAFFLENVESNQLTPHNIYNLYKNYSEEEDSIYPYSSTRLRRGYEYFFKD